MAVILETSLGDITIDLYTEERPRCCLNFLKLCKTKYYNWCLFHSVQRNLVAQTGDPTGTGRGGESVFAKLYGEQAGFFEMEIKPRIKHKKIGTVSMVNNGSAMHGSQFFITTGEDLDYLDGEHTVFGEVSEGMDTLTKINESICDDNHRPYQDIRIFHTVILDDPYGDPPGLEIPDRSPEPTKEQLDSHGYIGVDEEIDDSKGKSTQEIDEMMKEKEAKANAQILEMVGDLPDQEVAPEDNVLFVCKLNPVTTEEDLEIIFSRFGPIKCCEVIKDQKTGESLQYSFIEFEKPEHCENAYFKMDNVLIDDRRIHVDFSQSVAKVKWKGKGKGVEYAKKDKGREKDEQRGPRYVIKDKSKRGHEYDLVYSDEESDSERKQKKKKKHRSRSRDRSPSRDRSRRKEKEGRHDRNYDKSSKRERSPKRRSRSRSPRRKSSPRRRRSPSYEKSRKYKNYSPKRHREYR